MNVEYQWFLQTLQQTVFLPDLKNDEEAIVPGNLKTKMSKSTNHAACCLCYSKLKGHNSPLLIICLE